MAISLSNLSKNTVTITNESKPSGATVTWDEADFTWDEANFPWDNIGFPLTKPDKTAITITNETKS